MKIRTFTVPFAKVVGDEATELEFGPDDYMVVRPIFSMSAGEVRAWQERINGLIGRDGGVPNEEADEIVLDMLGATCVEWSLTGPEGPIPQPMTAEALLNLPGAIAGSLFSFLSNYRGEGPNPTKGS
jgi:hypothetical protein